MASELEDIDKAIEAVDQEIQDLEQILTKARKKRTDLQKQRTEIERNVQQAAAAQQNRGVQAAASATPATASEAPKTETPEELQARIAELQRQIESAEKAKGNPRARSRSRGRSTAPTKTAEAPRAEKKGTGWGLFGRSNNNNFKKTQDPAEQASQADPSAAASDSPSASPATAPAQPQQPAPAPSSPGIGSKSKTQWERPAWAHSMDIQDDRAVLSDPIDNGLKKEQAEGYRRQVFAKEVEIQHGKFVKPTTTGKAPDPRLAWIVMRVNGKGVPGKIVLHLHGKDLSKLVDRFVELKDMTAVMGGPNKASFTVESTPPLYITTMNAGGLDSKDGVYGVVQEGHDVLEKVVNSGGQLAIKQAHIYPVKRAKSDFSK